MTEITRNLFLRQCLALGLSSSLAAALTATGVLGASKPSKVVIVGAGAAGLTAGYLLRRAGVEVQIVEAAKRIGGRVKRLKGFADFPVDLGAEWIHDEPSVLGDIVDDASVLMDVETIDYEPQQFQSWVNGRLKQQNWLRRVYAEYKFKTTTWYGFFERFIVPTVRDQIHLNNPVSSIDYSGSQVVVKTKRGQVFRGDKVIVTVPVSMLQRDAIRFDPPMPKAQSRAIRGVVMGDGIKVFVEFSKRFYPDVLIFDPAAKVASGGDYKTVYDAAFGKGSRRHILGLFAINAQAAPYVRLSDRDVGAKLIGELDQIYDGQASRYYVKHVVQNWSKEPYIQGSYSYDFDDAEFDSMAEILAPLQQRVFFAGEALGGRNQATVHGACQSAHQTVKRVFAS